MTILPLTYLGSIEYFHHLINNECTIEQWANYQRQTNTNRCMIGTSNGIQILSIPIEKPTEKTAIKDIEIAYNIDWQTQHWRAIESAYNSAPFFEYFKDEIHPFYEKQYKFLIDFNIELQNCILKELNYSDVKYNLSTQYTTNEEINKINAIDLREAMLTKKKGVSLQCKCSTPYYQVFSHKNGFIENLSIIDLLFNMGMESRIYLSELKE